MVSFQGRGSPPVSYERRVGLGTVDGERLRFFFKGT